MKEVAAPEGLKPLKVRLGGVESVIESWREPGDHSTVFDLNHAVKTGPVCHGLYVRFYSTTGGDEAELVEVRAYEHHDCNFKYRENAELPDGVAKPDDQVWHKEFKIEDWPAVIEFV